ncbi:MAG: 50S ribosomal protein L22 [bacterium]|nr:50S ribosomal protein L22 [bacterium]
MQVIAKLNNLRISPRKVRLVADMVRGKSAGKAQASLGFCIKKGALPLKKLLDSAVANAKNNFKLEEKDLFISLIKVDEGRTLKRWRARARGRACRIEKKTSNITLNLDIFKQDKSKV